MPNCISKMMTLGMTLQEGILKSTVSPAKAIGRFPEIGTLSEGQTADIAVFAVEERCLCLQRCVAQEADGHQEAGR